VHAAGDSGLGRHVRLPQIGVRALAVTGYNRGLVTESNEGVYPAGTH
jgi:hypothetical protein